MFQLTPVLTISYTPRPQIVVHDHCDACIELVLNCGDAEKGAVTKSIDAGWSSLVARRAHNPKVVGSNPAPATNLTADRCLLAVTSKAPFGAFLWPLVEAVWRKNDVGEGSEFNAALAADDRIDGL